MPLHRFSVVHGSFAKKEAGLLERAEAAEQSSGEWRSKAQHAERALAAAEAAAASAQRCVCVLFFLCVCLCVDACVHVCMHACMRRHYDLGYKP